jgi:hypothetical protein
MNYKTSFKIIYELSLENEPQKQCYVVVLRFVIASAFLFCIVWLPNEVTIKVWVRG